MKTLKEKLKLVPSPIREMIDKAIKNCKWDQSELNMLWESFNWFKNNVFDDPDFWDAVHKDLEHHVEQYNKRRKKCLT